MKREGVTLEWDARVVACRTMYEALKFHGVVVRDLCVGARHWHALARVGVASRRVGFGPGRDHFGSLRVGPRVRYGCTMDGDGPGWCRTPGRRSASLRAGRG